ncbi:primase-like DNA-binding domain-containing protein, partial [Vibrio parahaemolyticus]
EGLRPPARVVEATDEYRSEQDTIGGFLDERCEIAPSATVVSSELYVAYSRWCEENGLRAMSHRALSNELRGRNLTPYKLPNRGTR